MTPHDPVVTLVLPAHNAEAFIEDAMESVVAQTVEDWELVCVDDASTDRTANLIAEAARRDERVRLVSLTENVGHALARNEGLKHARGEFVANLDADDVCIEDRLERSLDVLSERPEVGLVGSVNHMIDASGVIIGHATEGAMDEAEVRDHLLNAGNVFTHSSIMVRRELIERVGGYDPRIQASVDYDLYLRLVPHCEMIRVEEPMALWRSHTEQISMSSRAMQAYFADLASRRARAKLRGRKFDEGREFALAERKANRGWHWLPQEAAELYGEARQHMSEGDSAAARFALGQAIRLCPGYVRAWPFYLASLLPGNAVSAISTSIHGAGKRFR